MNLEILLVVVPLIIGTLLSLVMALSLLIGRYISCYKVGALLFTGFFIWLLGYTLDFLASDISVKIMMVKLQHIGITMVPVLLFLLVMNVSGYTKWVGFKKVLILYTVVAITVALILTNEWHNLIYTEITNLNSGRYYITHVQYGIWFWVFIVHAFALFVIDVFILSRIIANRVKFFKLQSITIITAITVAWIGVPFDVLRLLPWGNFYVTPMALLASGSILIFSFRFLKTGDIMPVRFESGIRDEKDVVFVIDKRERLIRINPKGEELLKISFKDTVGKSIRCIWEDFHRFSSFKGNGKERYAAFKNGSKKLIYNVHVSTLSGSNKAESYKVFTLNDITERVEAEKAIKESEKKFRKIFENSRDGIYQSTMEGKYLDVNNAMIKMLGYDSRHELMSKDIGKDIYYSKKDRPKPDERDKTFITRLKKKDGTPIWVEINANIIHDGTKTAYCEGIVRDIDERIKAQQKIKYLSYHDYLTDLFNRYFFEQELKRLDSSRLYPICVIILDINGLKLVNDTFGRKEGDEILKKTAKIIKKCFRKEDIVARYGGDEFIILLTSTSKNVASKAVDRVNKDFKETFKKEFVSSISFGIAVKKSDDEDINDLVNDAEDSMYRRKLVEKQSSHSSIITSLQRALAERNYETYEHMERMKEYALKLGKEIKLSRDELSELGLLSALHDIGKISITDNIVLKPSKLTASEFEQMKKHSEIGHKIASTNPDLATIADGILYHHERWDGNGYPMGLKGEEIPLMARIITIVDSYDAMTSNRIYRKSQGKKYAVKELKENAGKQFDPVLTEHFIKILTGNGNKPDKKKKSASKTKS